MLQEICIYLRPEESSGDSQLFPSIKFFDDILTEIVGVDMQRFLCCSTCFRGDKERYFSNIGAGFVPLDSSERCKSFQSRTQEVGKPCLLDETHKSLIAHHTATQSQGKNRGHQKNEEQEEKNQRGREQNRQDHIERDNRDGEEKQTEKKRSRGDGWHYGMIIGNSEYDGKGLSNLPTIEEDRKLICDTLGNQQTFQINFTYSEHEWQIDDYTNVEDIGEQVEEFLKEVENNVTEARGKGGEAGTLYMFFLGHGGKVQGVDCLLGVKGTPYPVNSILHKILDKKCAKKIILILDCCRNRLDPKQFSLTEEAIIDAQEFTAFDKVIRIWSTQETHKATAKSGITFSEALCEVLEENPKGVKIDNLERILNERWGGRQKQLLNGIVKYKCKVDLDGEYDFMFPCD